MGEWIKLKNITFEKPGEKGSFYTFDWKQTIFYVNK